MPPFFIALKVEVLNLSQTSVAHCAAGKMRVAKPYGIDSGHRSGFAYHRLRYRQ